MKIDIPPTMIAYLPDAIIRFGYLHPEVEVAAVQGGVELSGTNDPEVAADFRFTVYRQKIFTETLPFRKALLDGVLG